MSAKRYIAVQNCELQRIAKLESGKWKEQQNWDPGSEKNTGFWEVKRTVKLGSRKWKEQQNWDPGSEKNSKKALHIYVIKSNNIWNNLKYENWRVTEIFGYNPLRKYIIPASSLKSVTVKVCKGNR